MTKYKTKNPPPKKILGLILSPTRELEKQTFDICKKLQEALHSLVKTSGFTVNLFIGGTNKDHDVKLYEEFGGNIFVGTPGKLREIFTCENFEETFDIKDLEILVLGKILIFF